MVVWQPKKYNQKKGKVLLSGKVMKLFCSLGEGHTFTYSSVILVYTAYKIKSTLQDISILKFHCVKYVSILIWIKKYENISQLTHQPTASIGGHH